MQKTTDNIIVLVTIASCGTVLMVASFIYIYIRNQNNLFKHRQQLQQAEMAHQKELLQVVLESQEEERIRIGRDLHDGVGAAISNLRLTIEMFNPASDAETYANFIRSSKRIIDKMMTDVRNISHNLSPVTLTYYGLVTAIEEQCAIINLSGQLKTTIVNNAVPVLERLNLTVSTALYRVLEELLNNTIKHAKASKANINFIADQNMLIVEYTDNGLGADIQTKKKGMGMQNIESRLTVINASYNIETASGQGFYIQIKYPLT